MTGSTSYKNIFKTTALFGFVQLFNIAIKATMVKIVAVLLGPEGMGIIGLFNSSINTLKTAAGLGIPQSAVRDISEAHGKKDENAISHTVGIVNRIIIITAAIGLFSTIIVAPFLSKWNFNSSSYTSSYLWLSIAVAFNIYYEGRQAILTGCRRMKDLAKTNMLGSLLGLITAVPCYFLWGIRGIVPSLIILALANVLISNYFVSKIRIVKRCLTSKAILKGSNQMVKMGIALMAVNFMGFLFDVIISSYISHSANLAMVGYYQAGTTIVSGYFGIIFTAMSTDYYPRISAVHSDNTILRQEMNKQSETGLLLVFPLVIAFIFLSNIFISILYNDNFIVSNQYTDIALIGTIMIVVSNSMGMILLAKQAVSLFIISVLIQRAILVGVYILLFNLLGLSGLGYAYIGTGLLHIIVMTIILKHHYNITINKRVIILMAIIIVIAVLSILARQINVLYLRYTIGGGLLSFAFFTCIFFCKKYMGINLISQILKRFKHQ